MKNTEEVPFMAQFAILTDPRVERTRKHPLINVLVIAVCAVISGAESWYDLEVYGEAKEKWLKTFLELPHGIPTHDTFARVFAAIDGEEFERLFFEWTQHLHQGKSSNHLSITHKLTGQRRWFFMAECHHGSMKNFREVNLRISG